MQTITPGQRPKRSPTWEIWRLNLGYFIRPGSETETGHPRVEPVFAYLIDRPGTTVLFDSGIGLVDQETEDHYRPTRYSLASALANIGKAPTDIDLIVNSHLHFDHCGANPSLAGRPIIVQANELAAAKEANYTMPALVDFPRARYEILDGTAEIAPDLHCLATPGHSVGHQSLIVLLSDETIVIAGQATDTASAFASEQLACTASHEAARELAPWHDWVPVLETFDPRKVLFAHDAAIWERPSALVPMSSRG